MIRGRGYGYVTGRGGPAEGQLDATASARRFAWILSVSVLVTNPPSLPPSPSLTFLMVFTDNIVIRSREYTDGSEYGQGSNSTSATTHIPDHYVRRLWRKPLKLVEESGESTVSVRTCLLGLLNASVTEHLLPRLHSPTRTPEIALCFFPLPRWEIP